MATESVDLEALIRGRHSRRRWFLPAAALVLLLIMGVGLLALQPGDSDVVVEPRVIEATLGRLTSTVDLSGSAAAAQSDSLSFGTDGTIAAVEVEVGDHVIAGQVLALLDVRWLELTLVEEQLNLDLQRAKLAELQETDALELTLVEEQLNLDLQRAKLAELLETDATALAAMATARQSVVTAESRFADAELALADLVAGPTTAALAAANRATAKQELVLLEARETLDKLLAEPTEGELAAADLRVAKAEATLLAAADDLTVATGVREKSESLAAFLAGDNNVRGEYVLSLLLSKPGDVLVADAAETEVGADFEVARIALEDARADSVVVKAGPGTAEIEIARREVELAEATLGDLTVAWQELVDWQLWSWGTLEGLDVERDRQLNTARAEVVGTEAILVRERADLTELLAGAVASDILSAELAVARAETDFADAEEALRNATLLAPFDGVAVASDILSAELAVARAETDFVDAEEALRNATLLAPFDGVIEEIRFDTGDKISPAAIIFLLTDSDHIVVDLTVTEGDLLDLEPGQVGLATFDAIDGVDYPVRVTSVSNLPVIAQGVVTYAVEAEVLSMSELGNITEELNALRGGTEGRSGDIAAGASPGSADGGSARAARFFEQLLVGVELPEGVMVQEVLLAIANDQPLPEGVTLPEGFELPEQIRQQLAGGRFFGRAGSSVGSGTMAGAEVGARPFPAPGMSASVTLLAEVRPQAVLVPVAAVRQLGSEFIVTVPAQNGVTERITVRVGSSDATSVEILEGVEAGDTLLMGAETAGVPFSATQQISAAQETQNVPPGRQGGFGGSGGRPPGPPR